MQLESGGTLFLLYTILNCLGGDAAIPALWRREGVKFDLGVENLGSRGVASNVISNKEKMELIEEALRWARNLQRESLRVDKRVLDPPSEDDKINQLHQELKDNTNEIHNLQSTICDILQMMCNFQKEPCKPCPWVSPSTVEPKTTTLSAQAITSPAKKPRPAPSPEGSCGNPPAPDNGYVEGNSTMYNALIILHCNPGFDLKGDTRMICIAIWDASNAKYQYSWAPRMSAICTANGDPSSPAKTTTTTTTIPTESNKVKSGKAA